jgi:hypothetical protein
MRKSFPVKDHIREALVHNQKVGAALKKVLKHVDKECRLTRDIREALRKGDEARVALAIVLIKAHNKRVSHH